MLLNRYVDLRCPGARTSGIARTRLIDDCLTASLQNGFSQVVILGAGFDSRAHRISGGKPVRFFEVDHRDTLHFKRTRLQTIPGSCNSGIRYIEIDFNTQTLNEGLTGAGFDPVQRTFFIWEGVTNYLAPEAVAATLQFIGSVAHRSQLIFTYVHRDFFRTPHLFPGALRLKRDLERLGEPWTFGLDPAEIPLLLRRYGLCVLKDLGSIEYRTGYLEKTRRTLWGYEFYRAALAEVNPIWNENEKSGTTQKKEVTSNA